MVENQIIPLHKSRMGQGIRIHALPEGIIRTYFIRLGIKEGEYVTCFERLPGGTVIIQKNRQQIAVGYDLARQILVMVMNERQPE